MVNLMVLATVVFAYGLVSRRLEGTVLTAPIIFVVAGIVLGPAGLGLVEEAPMLGGRDQIEAVVALTVLLSVLLHGVTAAPLSAAYARRVDAMSKDVAEKRLYHSDAGGSPLRQRGGSSRSHGRPNG